ncbi:MAG: adenylate/guanylate cyclase domain-containing protein, partial [Candidatus Wallbacteria bacterium]|nr:adenylate/guanylate cyclase domain-containing protein [Candidatus Wallbacteria bacterium]
MIECSKCRSNCPDGSKFCLECGNRLDLTASEDELKLVSILFADIKGFTAMSERLNPDEVKEIIDDIFSRLTAEIVSEGGEIVKYEGDCIMAAFGLTVSTELDPVHSCYAALRIREQAARFSEESAAAGRPRLEVRVGIHTGRVVKGLIGGKPDIIGDAVNTAARMEQNAPVGGIMATAEHARLLRGRFKIRSCPKIEVKGKNNPVQTFLILDRAPIRQRNILGRETAFIGREAEYRACIEILREAETSRKPRMIVIEGQPGLGKSRIVREFNRYCDALPYNLVMTQVFYDSSVRIDCRMLKSLIRQKFESSSIDGLIRVLETREAVWDEMAEHAAILSALTGIGDDAVSKDNVTNMARAGRKAAEELFRHLTVRDPYIFFLDDIQWIDETSAELIQHLLKWGEGRLLFACTARPGWQERFGALPESSMSVLQLEPFGPSLCRSLIECLAGSTELPEDLVSTIESHAGGSPLFVEEV